jgi:serine-type D-Ala-D-Ala carboxypeptidase/endopeptidase (penicillin-binding protein 4)
MVVFPAADPTFLHPDYTAQPVYEKLKNIKSVYWDLTAWQTQRWGNGWSWNDYDAYYMAERSPFPVFGNVINFKLTGNQLQRAVNVRVSSDYPDSSIQFSPVNETVNSRNFNIDRQLDGNEFILKSSLSAFQNAEVPFRTDAAFVSQLLKDTLKAERVIPSYIPAIQNVRSTATAIYSQPADAMLKPLMHRSDNFFAEQTLLMVSNKLLGVMNERKLIDTLLATDFKDLPQKPRWADGSGLSRYNLFTPQDFIAILEKMKNEFGMPRIQNIFATGNTGTLKNYYVSDSSFIYAKTGTLSGVVALSGFLITQKNKLLIFSVLVNNHQATSTDIRRGVEKFIQQLRRDY